MQKIHDAGWVWRDCKPMNLIVAQDGSLRPLDFEGACRTNRFDPVPWGTPRYIPPNHEYLQLSRAPDDFFALGATLYQLFMGRPPGGKFTQRRRNKLGERAPQEVVNVVAQLLDSDPGKRLKPRCVARTFRNLL
jgi:serine/threonine protein kinase